MREMKESGIDWIGKIPENWKIGKVKDIFIRKNEKANDENPTVLSLARSGVKIRDISTGEGQLAESYNNYNPVEIGDLLLNPMDLYSGANCSVSKVKGVISPAYINLKAKGKNNSTYYDYFFKTQYWGMVLFAHGKGVSFDNRWTLGLDTALNYFIPVPKETEQDKIAAFLDKRIYEIDNIIEKTKETIEDYKKYKRSIITEIITKGLDKNVEMKDSGIEWIKDIPVNYRILAIKNLFYIYTGATPKTDNQENWNGNINWITPTDFKTEDKYIINGERSITEKGYKSCGTSLVPSGSIIFTKRAPIGTVAISKIELCTNQGCLACVKKNKNVNIEYYYYMFSSLTNEFNLYGTGTTFKEISTSNFSDFKIIYAPIEEQNIIVNYLNKKCKEIDCLIESKEKIVEELEQYKKSLIYEYVTGKKEVV